MSTAQRQRRKRVEYSVMCRADGCPNRWTVNTEGACRLCRAHAWAPTNLWPLITNEQLRSAQQ